VRTRSLALAAVHGFAAMLALRVDPAQAHTTLHEIVRSKAIAVRVYESDGEAIGDALWEVYSPASPGAPWQKGRTDRNGWLAFVPDYAGKWRVRVIEKTGHGLDTRIDAESAPIPTAVSIAPIAPCSSAPLQVAATRVDESGWAIGFIVRPLLGVGVIVALFAGLFLFYRSRGQS
jgi:nickel transport protein